MSSKNSESSLDSSFRTSPSFALRIHNSSDLRRVFDKFDSNADGKISSSELESMLRSLGSLAAAEEAKSVMETADTNADGYISFDEFLAVNAAETDASKCVEDLRNAFEVFDRDKNGLISAEELQGVLSAIGEKASLADCQKMIKGVDQSGKGAVDFDDFLRMMSRSSP